MKSEPSVYGISDLSKEGSTLWDGIRNYQARNYMRKMKPGERAFFYHSNCKVPGIVGLMEIIETLIIDPSQYDKSSKYFEPKSSNGNPIWDCARLRYLGKFKSILSLNELKSLYSEEEMPVVKKGNRLSILPVPKKTADNLLIRLGDFE